MCGICGMLSPNRQVSWNETHLRQMIATLRHRGPDDEGLYIGSAGTGSEGYQIGLGMRRLSVIDLETGKQPIHNEDKTVWIILNGEIYNYRELRSELKGKGHHFHTASDTEVIAHSYEEVGEECVQKLNGMFSFALWDQKKGMLLLARDRIGIKPLYYTWVGEEFVFGSEIKAILPFPGVNRQVDLAALSEYLTFEYVPAAHSLFKGIYKLSPGHLMICQEGKHQKKRYWDISRKYAQPLNKSIEDYSEELRMLLRQSVKRRLISDVPLGVFLSGGIDSSTIVALMSELSPGRVKTFTIGFEEKSFDESHHAKEIACYFGTEHHQEILNSAKVFELLPKVMNFLDEPIGDASILPTYLLAEFTRRHVTVALGGDGGDELFAGYPTYKAHRLAPIYMGLPGFIRRHVIEKLVYRLPVSMENFSLDYRAKKFVSAVNYPPEIRHFLWLGSFDQNEKNELLLPWTKQKLKEVEQFDIINQYSLEHLNNNLIQKMLYLDLKTYLQDDILVKVDRASMANSLEARVPFLDHTFVEFVAAMPAELKLKRLQSKYILKKSMSKILPEGILNRKKKGFGIPVAFWIQRELKDFVLDTLASHRLKEEGIFNVNYVEKLLKEHFNNRRDNRKHIWTLLMFELWYRRYIA